MACVGGGSNSIGMFADFIDEKDVKLVGVEAAGLGIETGKHASAMALGQTGCFTRHEVLISYRMTTETSSWHIRFLPGWIIRVLDRSTRICGTAAVQQYVCNHG